MDIPCFALPVKYCSQVGLINALCKSCLMRQQAQLGYTFSRHFSHNTSTMVIDDRMVKLLIWYDNEYGYAFRMADLAARGARDL